MSAAALAALTVTGAGLITAPAAVAAPEDPDVVEIHRVGRDDFNDPDNHRDRVCDFYLAAFNFEPGQEISWRIDNQPPLPGDAGPVATGSITVAGNGTNPNAGNGYTQPVMPRGQVRFPNGQYRLTWQIVEDPIPSPSPSPSPSPGVVTRDFTVNCPPTAPHGGPPAGGGGLAMTQDFTPVAGAAAVGLAAVGGVVYLRLRRRRPDGAA
ncbi:hypothetical protein [Streptomyces capitiformicae]|uniref:hypothetical protein n=1 Tax=Streptomyces capitiformicae TaxID=2014920 RepID=UPI0027E4B060|nr:hypothetical protein [Streptomyces capitiformicae]